MPKGGKAFAFLLLACLAAGGASVWARSVVLLIAAWSGSAASEVTLDGSLGGARGPLPGPDFEIGADFGRRVGSNLFHSFGAFNLSASESATFSGPNGIKNVLGRVTGGSGSNIDGLLRSTIPDANLFLLNPAGIVFGPSATLDVQGSFHASTGDFIRLADGRRFDAVPSANDALLTTKPPQAFGFLGRQDPAPIEVNGSSLQVPDGKTLSLIGGDIQVRGSQLIAPAGRVNLASIDAKAEVTLGPDDLVVEPRGRGGAATLSEGSLIDTSGEGGGSVFIRGGEFVMDRSEVRSITRGNKNGGAVSFEAKQGELRNGARIGTIAMSSGRAGDVLVEADRVSLSGDESPSLSGLPGGIGSAAFDSGAAGTVVVKAKDVEVRKGAAISTLTRGSGRGGNVRVEADRMSLFGDGAFFPFFPTGIITAAVGQTSVRAGSAGNLTVKTGDLKVRNGARIASTTEANAGRAGNVLVEADRVALSGDQSLFPTDLPGGIGSVAIDSDAGAVTVKARDLEVRNRAVIGSTTRGSGRGGNVLVEADRVFLSGPFPTGIGARPLGNGATGTVTIKAGELQVHNGARISSTTAGSAPGGDIIVTADEILLDDASITSESTSDSPDAGRSGEIFIQATDSFRLFNDSQVSVQTQQAVAGDITLHVGFLLHLREESSITTSVAPGTDEKGTGSGGDINIDPVFTVLDGGSQIIANALEGSAGNIRIRTHFLFRSPDSEIKASNRFGVQGNIEIDSPETDLNAGLVPLPASFLDAAQVLLRPCAVRSGADVIRLVVRPYEVLPDSPYALRVQRPEAPPGASGGWRGERGTATPAPLALGCLDGA